ncbi:MAG: arylesterase [Candidatus Moranbacteria bacterium]|nr:arylesterase [Candidatus Moranbacteria bacterium]
MSKKALLFVSVGAVLIGLLVFWYFSRDWEIKNYPSSKSGPVLMFGDSLVEGVGATAGNTLPDQLGKSIGISILNYGVSGDTTRDGLARLSPALKENPKVAIILLGGNDFLKKIPREETFQNLEKIVVAFQAQGSITVVVGVRSGIVSGGADEEYEALAERTGSIYVSDVLSGVFAHSDLMSDALHPNDRGYQQIAERLTPLLSKYLK